MMIKYDGACGSTVFCDDIRFETDGKLTFVGVYTHELNVHAPLPVTLPKFGMFISYYEDRGRYSGKICFRANFVQTSGDPIELFRTELDRPADDGANPDRKRSAIMIPIVFSPLGIPSTGEINVVADCDGSEVRIGKLRVISSPATAPTP